jgi:hypothetical protein
VRRTVAGAVLLLLLPAGLAVAYWAGAIDLPGMTAMLAPTELAPGAGRELEVRSSGSDVEANLEVWDLPETGPDEYYELWFGKEDERVSAGTTLQVGTKHHPSEVNARLLGELL